MTSLHGTPPLIEHQPTEEASTRRKKGEFGGFYEVDVYRFVCTCGHATTWDEDVESARRRALRHAIPGQLGLDIS